MELFGHKHKRFSVKNGMAIKKTGECPLKHDGGIVKIRHSTEEVGTMRA